MGFIQIIPDKCRYEVLSTKVEIRLAKAEIITWASLEYVKGQALLPKPNVASGFFYPATFFFCFQTAIVQSLNH